MLDNLSHRLTDAQAQAYFSAPLRREAHRSLVLRELRYRARRTLPALETSCIVAFPGDLAPIGLNLIGFKAAPALEILIDFLNAAQEHALPRVLCLHGNRHVPVSILRYELGMRRLRPSACQVAFNVVPEAFATSPDMRIDIDSAMVDLPGGSWDRWPLPLGGTRPAAPPNVAQDLGALVPQIDHLIRSLSFWIDG